LRRKLPPETSELNFTIDRKYTLLKLFAEKFLDIGRSIESYWEGITVRLFDPEEGGRSSIISIDI
jgi:hypothetical protein